MNPILKLKFSKHKKLYDLSCVTSDISQTPCYKFCGAHQRHRKTGATVAEQHHVYLGTKVDTEGRRCDFKHFVPLQILSQICVTCTHAFH